MESFFMLDNLPVRVSDNKMQKQPILLLHGYLETLEVWEPFLPFLNAAFRVISFDLPGHGLSAWNGDCCSVQDSARTVKKYLDLMGIVAEGGRVVVVGHSMGGYIAQAFAQAYPELVEALVLFHSTPYADSPEKMLARDEEIEEILSDNLEAVVQRSIPLMFAPCNRKRLEEVIEEICGNALLHQAEGICACLRGMQRRPSFESFLATFKGKLSFFFGEQDIYIPISRAMQIAQDYPLAKAIFLKDCGHNGFIENPSVVANELFDFLGV